MTPNSINWTFHVSVNIELKIVCVWAYTYVKNLENSEDPLIPNENRTWVDNFPSYSKSALFSLTHTSDITHKQAC